MANSKNFNFLNKIVKNLNKDTEKPIDIDDIFDGHLVMAYHYDELSSILMFEGEDEDGEILADVQFFIEDNSLHFEWVDKNHLFLLVDILNAFKKQYKIKKISISRDIDNSSQWKNTLKTLI